MRAEMKSTFAGRWKADRSFFATAEAKRKINGLLRSFDPLLEAFPVV